MEHIDDHDRSRFAQLLGATSLAAALLLAGCATSPSAEPNALPAAAQAIGNAEKAGAATCAAAELATARQHLSSARIELEAKHEEVAARHAERARADAEFASAKCGLAKARAIDDQMDKDAEALKQEMQRNTGAAR